MMVHALAVGPRKFLSAVLTKSPLNPVILMTTIADLRAALDP